MANPHQRSMSNAQSSRYIPTDRLCAMLLSKSRKTRRKLKRLNKIAKAKAQRANRYKDL
jgi:hypothetical protein